MSFFLAVCLSWFEKGKQEDAQCFCPVQECSGRLGNVPQRSVKGSGSSVERLLDKIPDGSRRVRRVPWSSFVSFVGVPGVEWLAWVPKRYGFEAARGRGLRFWKGSCCWGCHLGLFRRNTRKSSLVCFFPLIFKHPSGFPDTPQVEEEAEEGGPRVRIESPRSSHAAESQGSENQQGSRALQKATKQCPIRTKYRPNVERELEHMKQHEGDIAKNLLKIARRYERPQSTAELSAWSPVVQRELACEHELNPSLQSLEHSGLDPFWNMYRLCKRDQIRCVRRLLFAALWR